jgi:hypothetical protein
MFNNGLIRHRADVRSKPVMDLRVLRAEAAACGARFGAKSHPNARDH